MRIMTMPVLLLLPAIGQFGDVYAISTFNRPISSYANQKLTQPGSTAIVIYTPSREPGIHTPMLPVYCQRRPHAYSPAYYYTKSMAAIVNFHKMFHHKTKRITRLFTKFTGDLMDEW